MQPRYFCAGITYAGNHGMEINNADGTTFTQTVSVDYKEKLMKMLDTLNREVRNALLKERIRLYQA